MKYFLLPEIIFCLFTSPLFTQNCLPQGIQFTTQHDIDMFPVNHPGCFYLDGSVVIQGDDIVNLNGLSQIISIAFGLTIQNNPNLVNLTGLENLHLISGDLMILYNNSLTSLNGLTRIDSIQSLTVYGNPNLESIGGIGSIREIEQYVAILNNPKLQNLSGLDSIQILTGELRIQNNIALMDLHGLEALRSILELNLYNNFHLINLNGLSSLDSIHHALIISANDALVNLEGLKRLKYIRTELQLTNNKIIQHPTGMDSINFIGDLAFTRNPAIEDFEGLESLTSLGTINLYGNLSLRNLNGLSSLKSMDGYLTLDDNDQLDDIQELQELDFSDLQGLLIRNSGSIANCSIESICNYIAQGGTYGFTDNAVGCNTPQEVIDRCTVGIEDPGKADFIIYPNPTKGILKISNFDIDHAIIQIFDVQGRNLNGFTIFDNSIDLSNLSQGIYFITIQTQNQRIVKRVIKE